MTAYTAPSGVRQFFPTKNERARPIKPLPSDRVSAPNQINILKAWTAISQRGTRAATVNEVAKAVGMAASTVAMTNPFFASIGLLQRLAVGTYAPSDDVVAAFANARDSDFALQKLGPTFRQAWFGQVLVPRLTYAPMEEQTAISLLEEAAVTGPEYKKALSVTLDLMAAVQVIERSGGQIRLLAKPSNGGYPHSPSTIVLDKQNNDAQFRVSIHIDSNDLTAWAPEQIAAFFDGLTKLLPAKNDK